jgi:hypothetical protein
VNAGAALPSSMAAIRNLLVGTAKTAV